jgi:hypothetical protein
MKTRALLLIGLMAVLILAVVAPVEAGGLSQDPQAQFFVGTWTGAIRLVKGATGRDWVMTLSSIDDSGNVKVSQYYIGPVWNLPPVDLEGRVTGVFKYEAGQPMVVMNVPGQTGRAKVILTKKGTGLQAKIFGSTADGVVVDLHRKK